MQRLGRPALPCRGAGVGESDVAVRGAHGQRACPRNEDVPRGERIEIGGGGEEPPCGVLGGFAVARASDKCDPGVLYIDSGHVVLFGQLGGERACDVRGVVAREDTLDRLRSARGVEIDAELAQHIRRLVRGMDEIEQVGVGRQRVAELSGHALGRVRRAFRSRELYGRRYVPFDPVAPEHEDQRGGQRADDVGQSPPLRRGDIPLVQPQRADIVAAEPGRRGVMNRIAGLEQPVDRRRSRAGAHAVGLDEEHSSTGALCSGVRCAPRQLFGRLEVPRVASEDLGLVRRTCPGPEQACRRRWGVFAAHRCPPDAPAATLATASSTERRLSARNPTRRQSSKIARRSSLPLAGSAASWAARSSRVAVVSKRTVRTK